jgi:hypothetical protein
MQKHEKIEKVTGSSGRDDNVAWKRYLALPNSIVIWTGAKRSGEICGLIQLSPKL